MDEMDLEALPLGSGQANSSGSNAAWPARPERREPEIDENITLPATATALDYAALVTYLRVPVYDCVLETSNPEDHALYTIVDGSGAEAYAVKRPLFK